MFKDKKIAVSNRQTNEILSLTIYIPQVVTLMNYLTNKQ